MEYNFNSPEQIRLVVMGKTGCGKSTTGNTILGTEKFKTGDDFASVTYDCQLGIEKIGNLSLEVLDCPGLFDTSKTPEQIGTTVMQSVAQMHPGPNAFLYVVRKGRYTDEEFGAYERLKALFDDTVLNYSIVLFTGVDLSGGLREASSTLVKQIKVKGPPNLQKVLQECDQRVVVFDNTAYDKQSQVDYLLQQVRSLNVKNQGAPYSCPKYASIGEKLEEEVSRRVQEIAKREAQKNVKYVTELEHGKTKAEEEALHAAEEVERNKSEMERMERETEQQLRLMEDKHASNLQSLNNAHAQMTDELSKVRTENARREKQMEEELSKLTKQQIEEKNQLLEQGKARENQLLLTLAQNQGSRESHSEEYKRQMNILQDQLKMLHTSLQNMESTNKNAMLRHQQEMEIIKLKLNKKKSRSWCALM